MDLDEIKRGLRAEIKKRENEQYFTFQCNIRQMCKDVLAKLEEQESEIAELKEIDSKNRSAYYKDLSMMAKDVEHHKYKRCLAMAKLCRSRACFYDTMRENNLDWGVKSDRAYKWHQRWLKIAEQIKEAK